MKTVVITGATRGIGHGLADSFLAQDCQVALSGRSSSSVVESEKILGTKYSPQRVAGFICDVTDPRQVQALWDSAKARFGSLDIWINNAGMANLMMPFWMHSPEEMEEVVRTNLLGTMYGSRVALQGMFAQGHGAVYNMEGLGSDGGRKVNGLTLYATTKAALRYLNDALILETKETPVIVGALRPGMVITRLVTAQYENTPEEMERASKVFNILADRVETVTPWLVARILANTKHGTRICWLTPAKIMFRFLVAPFVKRKVI